MSWSYRLVRRTHANGEVRYGVYEAFCDGAGKVWAITEEPVAAEGESVADVLEVLRVMALDAERRGTLNAEDVPEPGAVHPLDGDEGATDGRR